MLFRILSSVFLMFLSATYVSAANNSLVDSYWGLSGKRQVLHFAIDSNQASVQTNGPEEVSITLNDINEIKSSGFPRTPSSDPKTLTINEFNEHWAGNLPADNPLPATIRFNNQFLCVYLNSVSVDGESISFTAKPFGNMPELPLDGPAKFFIVETTR